MKVAVDTGPLEAGHAVRGIGVYTKHLTDAIKNLDKKKFKVEAVDLSEAHLEDYDLVHYTTFHPYFLSVPEDLQNKVVVTIHDLIQLIYPDVYAPGLKGRINLYKNKKRISDVDAVIAVSETTKKDVVRFMGIPAEKIHVVHEAPKEIYHTKNNANKRKNVKEQYQLPDKFVLFVGDVNYNKNLSTLIKATKKAKMQLVIAGKQAANLSDLIDDIRLLQGPRDYLRYLFGITHPELVHYKELHDLLKQDHVHTPGFVPDADLRQIYELASVYVQPSLYEGFGLPVLEAMSVGTPVIVSKTNSLVEVAGDAALVIDTTSSKKMTEVIKKVNKDKNLREDLIQKGKKRAKQFSWKKTAEETISVYKEVLDAK